jgi:uncharacterized protein (TIGR03435 family)
VFPCRFCTRFDKPLVRIRREIDHHMRAPLDYVLHKPVIDQTGLEGSFDYRELDAKIDQDNTDFEGSFTVFIRDIGSKLTSAKGPVETFVIEHAEKPLAN